MTKTLETIHKLELEFRGLQKQINAMCIETNRVRELAVEVALLKQTISKLTKTRELWGQRGWAVLTVALSATFSLITGMCAVLLTFYLNTSK